MEFKAKVTVVDTAEEINKKRETERAKKLLLEAFQILSQNDESIVKEAEEFLKGVGV